MKATQNKFFTKRRILFMTLGLGVLAGAGGFSYWYFFGKDKKANSSENPEDDFLKNISSSSNTPNTPHSPKPNSTPPKTSKASASTVNNFPIKKGSPKALVKELQLALIKTYGKSILPKFGADGYYGKELKDALISKGFPAEVDEAAFNKITGKEVIPPSGSASSLDAQTRDNIDITKNLWLNATNKKLDGVLVQLKRIKNVAHYIKVNELFKTIRLNGVRQTIVNGVLSSFSDSTSKQFISDALRQIGLKYNNEKWSLS